MPRKIRVFTTERLASFALLLGCAFLAKIMYSGEGFPALGFVVLHALATSWCATWFFQNFLKPDLIDRRFAFAAGTLFAIAYGPTMFYRFYSYDDWTFLDSRFEGFSFSTLVAPINDHVVPLYRLFLILNSYISDPFYWGNAFAFFLSHLLIINLAGTLWRKNNLQPVAAGVLMIALAVWPSFDAARMWFSGGFWLAVPVAALFALLLLVHGQILSHEKISRLRSLIGFLFSAVAALSSSLMIAPVIYVIAYSCRLSDLKNPREFFARLRVHAVFLILIALPTIPAVLGRMAVPEPAADPSGLVNGQLFSNALAFALDKAFWISVPQFSSPVVLRVIGFLIAAGFILLALRNEKKHAQASRLILFGLFVLLMTCLQIGVARSWREETVLNNYYGTFPLFGCAFVAAGLWLLLREKSLFRSPVFSVVGSLVLMVITVKSIHIYWPREDYLAETRYRKAVVMALGDRVCKKLRAHPNPADQPFVLPMEITEEEARDRVRILDALPEYAEPSLHNGRLHNVIFSFAYTQCPEMFGPNAHILK